MSFLPSSFNESYHLEVQVVLATKADNTALAALREMVEKGGKVLPRSTSYKYLWLKLLRLFIWCILLRFSLIFYFAPRSMKFWSPYPLKSLVPWNLSTEVSSCFIIFQLWNLSWQFELIPAISGCWNERDNKKPWEDANEGTMSHSSCGTLVCPHPTQSFIYFILNTLFASELVCDIIQFFLGFSKTHSEHTWRGTVVGGRWFTWENCACHVWSRQRI